MTEKEQQSPAVAEGVAWVIDGFGVTDSAMMRDEAIGRGFDVQPLYAAPFTIQTGGVEDEPAAWAIAAEKAAADEYASWMGDPEGNDDTQAARMGAARVIEAHALSALSASGVSDKKIGGGE